MPRKVRNDLSYFTLDCDIFSTNSTLKPLIDRYVGDGLGLYIHILCDVYSKGYYYKPKNYEDYLYALAKELQMSVEKVQLIIAFMADRSLLDANCLNKNTVITSHGIQERYAEAMKGRKRSVAEIKGEYWLLSESEEQEIDTFYKTQPFANKSEKIGDKSEKIGDKSEIYSRTEQNGTERNITNKVVGLSDSDYADLCTQIGKDSCDHYIERVMAFRKKNPTATFDTKTTILKWYRQDKAKDEKNAKSNEFTPRDGYGEFELLKDEEI